MSLADIHLVPMMAYFTAAPEGRALLSGYRRLYAWWEGMQKRESMITTDPGYPEQNPL